ncbi:AsmA family protein [Maribacter algarum]|uniref:AsmA family protein n=1 Tax=Maribacter algarum (ex Zhang et al. 2020) TaxID=2578118 RepID=A0A5S3PY22_9FLAO|nr:AsmA-like C-terminal region-containing protein [Maribacter algarum]TMM58187.1 AsmA family protein [Maribacter algarum]
MGKKFLKIIGILLLLVVGVLIAAPFILEAKIGDIIKNNVNNTVNATLDFSDASLSLVRSFPDAEVSLTDITLLNKAPFEGDTLFAAKQVDLKMGIRQLFKNENESIAIESLFIDGANLNIVVDESENANYDIGGDSATESELKAEESTGFQLDMKSYEIINSSISYLDKSSGMSFELSNLQHEGKGDLSLASSELDTHTEALVSFEMDSTNYLNENRVLLDAVIGIDLEERKYTFLKNEAVINQLPLIFDGFVKVNEDNQEVDISFKTLSSEFKNFLALIPQEYSKNIENVQTTGDFIVEGKFEGIVDDSYIPRFHIGINSDNASFKYPDLPKSVRNVFIDVDIVNKTGVTEDTYVDITKLSFMIDEDTFNMVANINELMGNTKVNAHLDGKMNLANIEQAYPVPADLDLKGILDADITTAFDMASVESQQYEKTETTGKMSLKDFEYNSEELLHPVKLKATALTFNPKTVTLNELDGTTGKTDFNATGTINNLLGYMFNNEKVEGDFDLKSDTFALSDFMTADETSETDTNSESDSTTTKEAELKIPSFLDANINASANTVLYDDLVLKNVKGNLRIKDEKATLSNMTTSIFSGKMAFDGEVSTKEETPTFNMKLGMDQLQIGETFKSLELFKVLAPVAEILKGKLNSDIELSGALTDNLTPDLLTLSGDMLANIFTKDFDTESSPLLQSLAGQLDFIDLKQLNLDDLKTKLSFKDGLVSVKPFTLNYKDIAINIDGGHSFDRKMDYKASMEVPAKYLGSEVNSLIAKIDDSQLDNLTLPVVANIGGDYNNPNVTTDLTSGIKTLTSRLIEIQKQKLINKGKDKATELLTDVLGGNSKEKDSTKTEDPTKDAVKDVLGGILGGNKKDTTATKTDSIPAKTEEDVVKEKAKDILGGFLNRKKKKDTTKSEKDSIN